MPFWRGDYPWRPYELGVRVGRLRGDVARRLSGSGGNSGELRAWLQSEYALDEKSARNLVDHVQRQLDAVGVISSDDTIVVETFPDAVGEMRMVVHSPFGGRINAAWALALADALRERAGLAVETQVNDDGILLRFPATSAGGDHGGFAPTLALAGGDVTRGGRPRRVRPYVDTGGHHPGHDRRGGARAHSG